MPAPTPYNLWDIPWQFNPQDLVPSDCTCVVGQVMPSPDLEIELLSDSVHNLTCMPIEWICLQFEEKDIFSLKILTKFRGQEDILHKSHETKPNECGVAQNKYIKWSTSQDWLCHIFDGTAMIFDISIIHTIYHLPPSYLFTYHQMAAIIIQTMSCHGSH